MDKPVILGITGKIASGKSTVGRYIKNQIGDTLLIDVDKVAKEIYCKNKNVRLELVQCFGEDVCSFDGAVNYKLLAEKVFSSEKELAKLNNLMFGLIEREIQTIIKANRYKKCIIIDAAILFSSNLYKLCDYIIWVKADVERRDDFLKLKNKHFSDEDIKLRVEGQHIKIIEKVVNFEIYNNGTLEDLYNQVNTIIPEIKLK
ncbi:MAG: dephospho-CoA kinase [Actinobacteria bacterium]|nr:dephospho-CoA kinase [Actinomycetota bacterium]